MNFRDRTLVALATPAARDGLFTNIGLSAIAETAYRLEPGAISAPWSAEFDRIELAPVFEQREEAQLDLALDLTTGRGAGRIDRRLPGEAPRLPDALWRGAVIGQGRIGGGRVAEVAGRFVGLGDVDETIDAGGGVPAAGPARDAARREEIARRLSEAAGKPGSIGPDEVARWVGATGTADLSSFLARDQAVELGGGFSIRFASDAPANPVPLRLSLDAAVFVVEPDTDDPTLADLIRATRHAQDLVSQDRRESQPTAGADRRVPVAGLWLAPLTWFDDGDWPGASPAARRDMANLWLREMGIAVAVPG